MKTKSLPCRLEIDGLDAYWMTREEALGYWQACAIMKKACRMLQVGEPGWITLDDKTRSEMRKKPITKECDRAMRTMIIEDVDLSPLDDLPIDVELDFDGEPSINIGQVALTPVVISGIRGGMFMWHVQSIDIDDHNDEFPIFSNALACAAARAVYRLTIERIQENNRYKDTTAEASL